LIHSCIPPTEFSDSMALLQDKLGVQKYLYKPHTSLQHLLRTIAEVVAAPEELRVADSIAPPLRRLATLLPSLPVPGQA
jgi:hypothetical protein